uniref:Tuberin n=1 Tax=Lygus hesperus TaxID=30085 RepID=A0A0K8TBU2_LYGHE
MSTKGSKDDIKALDKLKQFFRLQKSNPGACRFRDDFILTPEIEKEISFESSVATRIKALKELNEIVLKDRLEENAVGKFWCLLEDLLKENVSKENRHFVFSFFRSLIQGQWDKLGIMRAQFFKAIKAHNIADDLVPRLELLQGLTDNGKTITYFEEEIGFFLLEFMCPCISAGKEIELLGIIINVIKYHASYIDEDVMTGIMRSVCVLCCKSTNEKVVLSCLQVFDAVVCYSELPIDSLPAFISTLCRAVNLEVYCHQSWKIMKNLMGTHLGHSSLCTMLGILKSDNSLSDPGLLRGAIFYINMALWSSGRIKKLEVTPTAVLPAYITALRCQHNLVMYEVILGLQRLVSSQGNYLLNPSWSLIIQIISMVLEHIDHSERCDAVNILSRQLHETLSSIEDLIETNAFKGSSSAVFSIISKCYKSRPETSVERLIKYYSTTLSPVQEDWLSRLDALTTRFYDDEDRSSVRLKMLSLLCEIVSTNRFLFEKQLVKIVLDHLKDVADEADLTVRVSATNLLVDLFLNSKPEHANDVIVILEKILNRALDRKIRVREEEAEDIKNAAHGLIQGFTTTMYRYNPTPAIKAFLLMTSHLNSHYDQPDYMNQVSSVRNMILESLVHLRADSFYRVGILGHDPLYSMFLMAHPPPETGKVKLPPSTPILRNPLVPEFHQSQSIEQAAPEELNDHYEVTGCDVLHTLSIAYATKAIVKALKVETDWKVMLMILRELPIMLQNRALFVTENELLRQKSDLQIDCVATAICAMICDRGLCLPDRLVNTPPKFTRSDFQSYVFPVLAALIPYQTHLEPSLQQRIIKCLECVGLSSRCSKLCVNALTICTLEMRDAMVKLLPEVLLNLSKISATVHIAIPILEFLSTLTQLPNLFANFVQDQYMSVFAISLPYTNPFKYNHYTVSLAHHVIAAWFLKCRLPFRRDFVKFITTGLKANILVPFEEGRMMAREEIVNEDSSNRKRSSSLTEQGSRRRHQLSSISRPQPPPIDNMQMSFHKELTETCIDLMAMYTYSTCSPVPKRQNTAEMVLNGGKSMTWLLGHKLTVTTSGCTLKALKHGLCDRCYQICRVEPRYALSKDGSEDKKSSKSENKSSESNASTSSTGPNTPDEEKTAFPEPEQAKIDQLIYGKSQEHQVCACWCKGWAEILVQRPTGSMSWSMRLQNEPHSVHWKDWKDNSNSDISTLFIPGKNEEIYVAKDRDRLQERVGSDPVSIPQSPIRRNVHHDMDDFDLIHDEEGSGRSRNPVRRSNSSPEMSSSWKNPLLNPDLEGDLGDSKKKQNYSKDMRVNCEAIPEEVGTTPPSAEAVLLSQDTHNDKKAHDPISPGLSKEAESRGPDPASLPPLAFKRDRGHTISVMSPARKPGRDWDLGNSKSQTSSSSSSSSKLKDVPRITSGVNPAFVSFSCTILLVLAALMKNPFSSITLHTPTLSEI